MYYSINIDFFLYLIVFSSIMLLMLLILVYIRIYKRIAAKREKINHDRFLKFLKIVISTIDNIEYDEFWHLESKLILDHFSSVNSFPFF